MNWTARFALWLLRISGDEYLDPSLRDIMGRTRNDLEKAEELVREARMRLALAIVDSKAANITRQPVNANSIEVEDDGSHRSR